MQFDIEEFHHSISKELLLKAIRYAKTLVNIIDEEINIIMHSKRSLLFNNTNLYIKRNEDPYFDVTLRSFDGAELCQLVDLYILQILGEKYGKHFNLSITCETDLKSVNFLDITLNLTTGKYQPYNKPDNNPLYINILSNHPANIIKNLLNNTFKRINTLSADETTFNESKDL